MKNSEENNFWSVLLLLNSDMCSFWNDLIFSTPVCLCGIIYFHQGKRLTTWGNTHTQIKVVLSSVRSITRRSWRSQTRIWRKWVWTHLERGGRWFSPSRVTLINQSNVELVKETFRWLIWLRNHHVDIWWINLNIWSIFMWNFCSAFFPHQIWVERGHFQKRPQWSLDTWKAERADVFHESWTRTWLPRVTAGDRIMWTQKTIALPIMHLGPVCASCHVGPQGPIKVWHDRWFPYKTREDRCAVTLRGNMQRSVTFSMNPLPVQHQYLVCKSVSDSLYLLFSFYCCSMQNFISFMYCSNIRMLSDNV